MKPTIKYLFAAIIVLAVSVSGCKKDEDKPDPQPVAPIVTTVEISQLTAVSATGGGNVTSDGGSAVTARGICWNTSQNPTISDNKTTNGTGVGTFTSSLTALIAKTTYYVRAYATNAAGTSYGQQVSFTTPDVEDTEPLMDVILYKSYGVTYIDGKEVSFNNIYAMTPDGSRAVLLHDGSAFSMQYTDASRAALNPAGTKLVLQGGDKFIWEYDLNTKQHTTVIPETEGINVDDPVYSIDGTKILYANWASGDILETILTNGAGRQVLTNDDWSLGRQNYTPDGTKIVASNWIPYEYLCTFNADGTGGVKILSGAGESFDCPYPAFNTRIIYVHYQGEEKEGTCSIRACNMDGSNPITLETLGDCSVDYLTCNEAGTQVGYFKSVSGTTSYIVRELSTTSLGATISTHTGGVRYRFGQIRKDLFDAAPQQ